MTDVMTGGSYQNATPPDCPPAVTLRGRVPTPGGATHASVHTSAGDTDTDDTTQGEAPRVAAEDGHRFCTDIHTHRVSR